MNEPPKIEHPFPIGTLCIVMPPAPPEACGLQAVITSGLKYSSRANNEGYIVDSPRGPAWAAKYILLPIPPDAGPGEDDADEAPNNDRKLASLPV